MRQAATRSQNISITKRSGISTGDSALRGTGEKEGTIADIRSAVLDGNSYYFIQLIGEDTYYSVSAVEQPLAVILNKGDQVVITYKTGEGSILDGVSVELR